MDFFGLGAAPEMETPLGLMVKSASDPLLLGPDWAKNLEICDSISSPGEAAEVTKAVFHQLKSSDPKVVQLALTLADTCMQNSWQYVPTTINKTFMGEIVNISRGRKGFQNQEEALRLIQVWGRRFEKKQSEVPIFFETYMSMRSQGVAFPPEEDAPAPQATSKSEKKKKSPSIPSDIEIDKNAKLTADLNVVLEKIRLCREMLPESPGISSDEALSEVVGFLEACQERMIDLIEAGTQGLLSEDLFEGCLRVNDALTRTLDAEKDGVVIGVDDGTALIGEKGSSTESASGGKSLTTSLLDDEADEFASLTMKTSTKKSNSSGSKKIPTIKGPKEGSKGSSGILLPPPPGTTQSIKPSPQLQQPPAQQQQQQQEQQQSLQQPSAGSNRLNTADFDILGSSTNQVPPPPQPSNVSNNPFDQTTTSEVQAPGVTRSNSSSNPLLSGGSNNNDIIDIFGDSGSTSTTTTTQQPPSTLGSSQMTDAEFESFLNSK